MSLDEKDRKIIHEMIRNSKQTTSELSKKLNIPITTVHNRIKKLEREKLILNYTVNLDYKKLGRPILAYIGVTVNYNVAGRAIDQNDVAAQLKKISGVQEVTIMTGMTDILIKVLATDIENLNDIVTVQMRRVAGVDKTHTSIVMKEV